LQILSLTRQRGPSRALPDTALLSAPAPPSCHGLAPSLSRRRCPPGWHKRGLCRRWPPTRPGRRDGDPPAPGLRQQRKPASATKTSLLFFPFGYIRGAQAGSAGSAWHGRAAVIPVAAHLWKIVSRHSATRLSCGRPRYDFLQRPTLNKSLGPRGFPIFLILLRFSGLARESSTQISRHERRPNAVIDVSTFREMGFDVLSCSSLYCSIPKLTASWNRKTCRRSWRRLDLIR